MRVPIAGSGPAGLAAALAVARHGGRARVYERRAEVGARFHGDFQGIENWTTGEDVLDEFARLGIAPAFEYTPFRECVFFDPDGRERVGRSSRPLWYLVRRGPDEGTLDRALRAQAEAAGVEIVFNHPVASLPDGGIAAVGPHRVNAIAVGYTFDTGHADGAFGAVSDELAPRGYSYLLIARGRATVASCMFDDFHRESEYLDRTVAFFERRVGVRPGPSARRFGGFGNMFVPAAFRHGRLMHAGEGAGLQDALFGFGIRAAIVSGHLAGAAAMNGGQAAYVAAAERRFGGLARAAAVNRYLYATLGARGYRELVGRVAAAPDARAWLRRYYNGGWWTRPLYPVARAWAAARKMTSPVAEGHAGCACTWCRLSAGAPRGFSDPAGPVAAG